MRFDLWLTIKRKELRLKQDQVAETVGVSRQTISNWERGIGIPTLTPSQMLRLITITQTTLQELVEVTQS